MNDLEMGSLDDIAQNLPLSGYIFLSVIGVVYFLIQHSVIHVILRMFYPGYTKLNTHDCHEYRMQVNGLVHATLATIFSVYCMFYTCPDGKTFLNNEECRTVARNSHVWTCLFTASYLLVDTVFILAFLGISTPIDKQTLVHHLVGFINYYLAFWQLGFPITIGACLIFLEVSTPFVVIRWLFFHHGLKGSIL